ncbi:MAG TPA: polyketide synthase dehydratase domain-containing protein, partial [Longimicrobiales bacterium]|nr:polyketide synthase dehydratase domain-containing protein [Longimicrobiales bacterium]
LPANHEPAGRPTLVMPRLVELAFQTAGLAEIARAQRMGLPFGFRKLCLHQPGNGEMESAAVVTAVDDGTFDVDVADTEGCGVLSLRGYRTSALPGTVDSTGFDPLRG